MSLGSYFFQKRRTKMLEQLKKEVYEANMELPRRGLITYTWGNVSGRDAETGYFVIKPSGVDYDALTPDDMVVMDLDGNKIEGKYKPSSDTATHIELYKKYPEIGGIVHTHSPEAVAWAQAGRDIPLYGTTHADYFLGPIPCARNLTTEEINEAYEKNTGVVIIETFENRGINPVYTPAVLCQNHGPFTWGKDAAEAVHNAVVLEEVAKMARNTELINPKVKPAPDNIKDKHFYRKHGENAYYGQQSVVKKLLWTIGGDIYGNRIRQNERRTFCGEIYIEKCKRNGGRSDHTRCDTAGDPCAGSRRQRA